MGRAVAALIPGHKQVNLAEGKANDQKYIKLGFVDFCDQNQNGNQITTSLTWMG